MHLTLFRPLASSQPIKNTFDDCGRGLGPVFVAMLISNLGGRTIAFNISVIGWMLCGVLNLLLYFTVEMDEADVQNRFADSLHQLTGYSLEETLQQGPDDSDPLLCTRRRQHPTPNNPQGGVV